MSTSSGLSYGRPDDFTVVLSDMTTETISGSEWIAINISTPLKIGNDNNSDLYVAVDRISAVTSALPTTGSVALEIYETFPYNNGNKIVYVESNYTTTIGLNGPSPRINFYKLCQTSSETPTNEFSKLHFRFLIGGITPIDFNTFTSIIITFQFSKTAGKYPSSVESNRPGHERGVKRVAPISR